MYVGITYCHVVLSNPASKTFLLTKMGTIGVPLKPPWRGLRADLFLDREGVCISIILLAVVIVI